MTICPRATEKTDYVVKATPLLANVIYNLTPNMRNLRINALAGLGAMIEAAAEVDFQHDHAAGGAETNIIPVQLVGRKNAPMAQGGVEVEYRLQNRLSVSARALGRYANSGDLDWKNPKFELYNFNGQGTNGPGFEIGGRSVDFSGFQATVGFRAYIGQ